MRKNIYFYWGNETMSYMRYMTLYSFCKHNPDWTVYLIKNDGVEVRALTETVEKQDSTEYKGADYSHLVADLNIDTITFTNDMINLPNDVVANMSDVHIKDILNWKLLAAEGGIVADMDILFLKPIGDSIHKQAEIGLICFDGNPQKDYIPVSFMYSSGNNEFFKKTYNNALKNYKLDIYESCGTMCIEENNLDEIRVNYPEYIVQKLADEIVFPFVAYPWGTGVEMLYVNDNTHLMRSNAIGIHWYGGAPLSQQFNNKINDKTLEFITNTITRNIWRIV